MKGVHATRVMATSITILTDEDGVDHVGLAIRCLNKQDVEQEVIFVFEKAEDAAVTAEALKTTAEEVLAPKEDQVLQ